MLSTARFTHLYKREQPEYEKITGRLHSYETGSSIDGPGIRFVVFTNGCPLACKYCHNPDTRDIKGGYPVTVGEVLSDIRKLRSYLVKGGVTVSGGEPLCQSGFTKAILQGSKAIGLHTALDTSGFLGIKADEEILDLIDLVLLDIKSGDEETYKKVTGRRLQPTLDFAKRLEAINKPVWIRFVLVPGLTDEPENIRNVAKIVKDLTNVERVEILPFHKMGEVKYKELKMPYELRETPAATLEDVEKAKAIFEEEGVEAFS